MFSSNEKCVEAMKEWQINIDNQPTSLSGHKMPAGDMLMGRGTQFDLENCPDIDRKIQNQMYE